MKTNQEHFSLMHKFQRGNAMIYVLIAIALFAALSFTLSRQTDTGEAGTLRAEQAELYATQIMSYAAQARNVLDQMQGTGSDVSELIFTLPTQGGFNAAAASANIHKVYHPQGGGLNPGTLAPAVVEGTETDPPPGWYLGRFMNVEWTPLAAGNTAGPAGAEAPYEDVILVAFQIKREICEKINENITGSTAIPVMTETVKEALIDATFFTGSNASEFTTGDPGDVCPDCGEYGALCVEGSGGLYGFYNVLAQQ